MSQMTRNIFLNSVSDKLAVSFPTTKQLLDRTISRAVMGDFSGSVGSYIRTVGKPGTKARLQAVKNMVNKIKQAQLPYEADQQTMRTWFPYFVDQRTDDMLRLPKAAQKKIKKGLDKMAKQLGFDSAESTQELLYGDNPIQRLQREDLLSKYKQELKHLGVSELF